MDNENNKSVAATLDDSEPILEGAETADNSSVKKVESLIDLVISWIASTVAQLVRATDAKEVTQSVKRILVTIMHINAADEYVDDVRVGGDRYLISEYVGTKGLADLLVGRACVLRECSSPRDFLDRKKFKPSGQPLTPSQFNLEVKKVCGKLRANPAVNPLSRPSRQLLSEAASFAVNGKKVADRNQRAILFLTTTFDDDTVVDLQEWARTIALSLFN